MGGARRIASVERQLPRRLRCCHRSGAWRPGDDGWRPAERALLGLAEAAVAKKQSCKTTRFSERVLSCHQTLPSINLGRKQHPRLERPIGHAIKGTIVDASYSPAKVRGERRALGVLENESFCDIPASDRRLWIWEFCGAGGRAYDVRTRVTRIF